MQTLFTMTTRTLLTVGAACLLLGLALRVQRADAATIVAAVQTLGITGVADRHWSYGQFDVSAGGWVAAHSRDNYGSASVPYSVLPSRWVACILHSFEAGHFVEVVWMWNSVP